MSSRCTWSPVGKIKKIIFTTSLCACLTQNPPLKSKSLFIIYLCTESKNQLAGKNVLCRSLCQYFLNKLHCNSMTISLLRRLIKFNETCRSLSVEMLETWNRQLLKDVTASIIIPCGPSMMEQPRTNLEPLEPHGILGCYIIANVK